MERERESERSERTKHLFNIQLQEQANLRVETTEERTGYRNETQPFKKERKTQIAKRTQK